MSAALARLRRHFHDDLLVRVGNAYELTPLAGGLVDPTRGRLHRRRAGLQRRARLPTGDVGAVVSR
jgi:hypothetical protein